MKVYNFKLATKIYLHSTKIATEYKRGLYIMLKELIEIKNDVNIDIIADMKGSNFKKFHFKNDRAENVRAYFYTDNLPKGCVIQVTSKISKECYSYTAKNKGNWYSMALNGNEISISVYLPTQRIESNTRLNLISIDYTCISTNIDTKGIIGEDARKNSVCYKNSNPDIFQHALSTMMIRANSYGSGSLIGTGNHVLTNSHVIWDQEVASRSVCWFNYYLPECEDSTTQSKMSQPIKLKAETLFLAGVSSSSTDDSLFSLDEFDFKYSNVKRLFGGLELQEENPQVGEPVYLPQYVWRESLVSVVQGLESDSPNCIITKVYDPEERIYYNCDTVGGASGSPVISRNSNKIVALHHQMFDEFANRGIAPVILWRDLSPFIQDTNKAVEGVPYPVNVHHCYR